MSECRTVDPIAFVVASHISQHPSLMDMAELRDLILTVRRAFDAELAAPVEPEAPSVAPLRKTPREVKASIKPDGIISFEDGKTYKTLTRHLSRRNLTPAQYKEKYGLHEDYPMVAPEYSKRRSELAKRMGLGTQR